MLHSTVPMSKCVPPLQQVLVDGYQLENTLCALLAQEAQQRTVSCMSGQAYTQSLCYE
jgi:hypothetical protein